MPRRSLSGVSEQHDPPVTPGWTSLTIDELARVQHTEEVRGPHDLVADIWESDAEVGDFLADFRSSRATSLG